MLGFKTIQSLKPNTEILEAIKDYKYKIKFAGLVKCPICNEILAASESLKKYKNETKIYYHLRCKTLIVKVMVITIIQIKLKIN